MSSGAGVARWFWPAAFRAAPRFPARLATGMATPHGWRGTASGSWRRQPSKGRAHAAASLLAAEPRVRSGRGAGATPRAAPAARRTRTDPGGAARPPPTRPRPAPACVRHAQLRPALWPSGPRPRSDSSRLRPAVGPARRLPAPARLFARARRGHARGRRCGPRATRRGPGYRRHAWRIAASTASARISPSTEIVFRPSSSPASAG